MNVLILGGTGLISSAVVKELKRKGHKVTVFHRGNRPLKMAGVGEILGDRYDSAGFLKALKGHRFDAVMDFICFSKKHAALTFKAFRGKVKHFIHCSTVCAVGGPLTRIPALETEPYQPLSGYGRGKRDAEKFYMARWKQNRFPVTIFRPSHTYGEGGGWILGPLLAGWDFEAGIAIRMLKNKKVILHGDGEGLWQSLDTRDAAVGFVGALKHRQKTVGQIYNICGAEVMTWREYYMRLGKALNRKPRIVCVPSDTIIKYCPKNATGFLAEIGRYHGAYSIEKIQRDIPEFKPKIELSRGLRDQVRWVKSQGGFEKTPPRPFEDKLIRRMEKL